MAPPSICLTSDLVVARSPDAPEAKLDDVLWGLLLFQFITVVVWVLVCFTIFVSCKQRYSRTRVRMTTFVASYAVGILLYSFTFLLSLVIGITNIRCWMYICSQILFLGFFMVGSFTRNSTFMLMTRLSFATYQFGRIPLQITADAEQKLAEMSLASWFCESLSLLWFGLKFVFQPSSVKSSITEENHLRTLLTLRFITSTKGSIFYAFVILFPSIVLAVIICLTVPPLRVGCTGCAPENYVATYSVVGWGTALFVNAVFFVIRCRKLPDVWQVFQEGRLISSRGGFPAFASMSIMLWSQLPYRYYFSLISTFAFCLMFYFATVHQIIAARNLELSTQANFDSHVPLKHLELMEHYGSQIDLVSSSNMQTPIDDIKGLHHLREILQHSELSRAFQYYLSTEFSYENLCFLQDTSAWRKSYNDVAKNALGSRAKKLINTYISDRGLYQLNISCDMSQKLLHLSNSISIDPDFIVSIDSFDEARVEVGTLLERGAVTRFMKTPEYAAITTGEAVVNAPV
jgi:hypothetical protein